MPGRQTEVVAVVALLFLVLATHISPVSCQQQQSISDCISEGLYLPPQATFSGCGTCPAGSYCPENSLLAFLCPPGTYQDLQQQGICKPCFANHYCTGNGTVFPVQCPDGRINPPGSPTECGECSYDKYFYNTTTRLCQSRTVFCNLDTHYEMPTPLNTTQESVCLPLTRCNTVRMDEPVPVIFGNPYGSLQFQPLHEYISTYNTRYTDRMCLKWRQCGSSDYVEQLPVHDGTGFLILNQSCKPLTRPTNSLTRQYKLVDGETTRDRDNIWVDCTVCNPSTQFIVSDCTDSADRVCKTFTSCDSQYEYVQRKGASFYDTVCAPKTNCNRASARAMYEKRPAVDSIRFDVNGTDAQCELYSKCPDGHFMSFVGDDTNDVRCTPCPPGMYRDAALFAMQDGSNGSVAYCRECPAGTYSNASGAVACTPCSQCSDQKNVKNASCPFSPPDKYCVAAIKTPCSTTQDAVCTMCPSLADPKSGFYVNSDNGVCTACKPGYHYNESEPVEGKRCVLCPSGYYCPSKDAQILCPGTAIFLSEAKKFVTVPQTTPTLGAYKVEHCNCSIAGGFQASRYSQALLGCEACPDGYYSPPGGGSVQQCQRCPQGKYAAQKHGLRDYLQCPSADSPKALVLDSTTTSDCSVSLNNVTVGATECTSCPPDRPYTWTVAVDYYHSEAGVASSISDCKQCPRDYFFDDAQGRCIKCARRCVFPDEYETTTCTEYEDRTCGRCELDSCDPATEYPLFNVTGEACPGPIDPHRACGACTNKPENSVYIPPSQESALTNEYCKWRCLAGYYSRPGTTDGCAPCTPTTSENCKPGFLMERCSEFLGYDASCNTPCDGKALGKPDDNDETSEWVWTTFAPDGSASGVVLNPTGGTDGKPNIGCMWRCKEGYLLRQIDSGVGGVSAKLSYCVK